MSKAVKTFYSLNTKSPKVVRKILKVKRVRLSIYENYFRDGIVSDSKHLQAYKSINGNLKKDTPYLHDKLLENKTAT